MNTEILGVVAQIVLMIVLSYPLGKYMARVYKGEKSLVGFHAAGRKPDFPILRYPSARRNELEAVLESFAGGEPVLVYLGYDTAGDSGQSSA